jgi:ubiquinone/menaquinone biosynthesis C-methylase UbiE
MEHTTYVIDPDNVAEMGRLINQDRLITRAMGGLFPPELDPSGAHRVLDIACGPGGWVQEVAFHYPDLKVTGIDASYWMVRYASQLARVQGLENASFQIVDATRPLPFADASFQVVTVRLANAFLPTWQAWRNLVGEMARVTAPGGLLRLTEADDAGLTSSPAFERMKSLALQAGQLDQRPYPITPYLRRLLREAGCQHLGSQAYALCFSADEIGFQGWYENCRTLFSLLQPFLIKKGVATQETLDQLYEQILCEMRAEDFAGIWYLFSAWGYKPQESMLSEPGDEEATLSEAEAGRDL